jgi:mono/diheme cytochrome c family protein
MNRNKHLLLWSSLGVLALLLCAAVEENFLRPWRLIQASARGETGPVEVRLRQIVLPQLQVTDRCISCHLGMAPGEQPLTRSPSVAAHKPVFHSPDNLGCTVCHGGQGRATEKADAHGLVPFWPEPMIPAKYSYAGCGSCHTHVQVPNQHQLARGLGLIERYDCLSCHRLDERGGTVRPGAAAGLEAPDLSGIGAAHSRVSWYTKHVTKHHKAVSGPWKTSFGPIPENDRQTIDGYLASRVGAPQLVEAKALFNSLGCRGCHKVGGVGGDDGPDLTRAGQKDPGRLDFSHVRAQPTVANWHAEHLRHPARVVPGSQMPELHLTELHIDLLTFYLLSLRRSPVPEAFWPRDRIRAERFGEREFAMDGATLFGSFCAGCHGPTGQGRRYPGSVPFPAIGNPDFLAVASDEFLTATIRQGRPGRRMPSWGEKEGGLRPEEITQVVAHLRQQGGGPDTHISRPARRRWVKADPLTLPSPPGGGEGRVRGQALFSQFCAGCHGPRGEGTDAPALGNKMFLAAAGDTYLVETIKRGRRGTLMPGFQVPAPTNPVLSDGEIESVVAFMRTWEGAAR